MPRKADDGDAPVVGRSLSDDGVAQSIRTLCMRGGEQASLAGWDTQQAGLGDYPTTDTMTRPSDEQPEPDTPEPHTEWTDDKLISRSRAYAEEFAEETDVIDVDVSPVTWEVSHQLKRTAAKVGYNTKTDEINYLRMSRKAFDVFGWESWCEVIRHELIHVWQIQTYGEGDHGKEFKRKAEKLGCDVKCDAFSPAKYLVRCDDCGTETRRYQRSKVVKHPERYGCGECDGMLTTYYGPAHDKDGEMHG